MKTLTINPDRVSRLVPTSPVFQSAGYRDDYIKTGAYRQVPYHVWLQEQAEKAGMEGRTFKTPETKPDGTIEGLSHVADRDEIIARFAALLKPGTSEQDAAAAARAQELSDLGGLARRAAAGDGEALEQAVQRSMAQLRAADPNVSNVGTPIDFAAQFATPLDTTEIITMCDETGLWRALPEVTGDTHTELWRELNELDFSTGNARVAFPKGECPEEFRHDGDNRSVVLKHIGAKKSLTESDILHSRGSIAAGYGMRRLLGPFREGGAPGENDVATMVSQNISDLKEKEMALASILVMNGWDQLLVDGDDSVDADEFDGLVTQITAENGARCNGGTSTGTFAVSHFNQFLMAGCARPDAIIGHPAALAAVATAYSEIGNQTIFFDSNQRVVPGIHFAGEVMTVYGPVALIADTRFPITDNGDGTITTTLFPVKLRHNGEPLIYKRTQIPLSFKDLAPGCTAVSFELYAVTALVVKAMCAQACYTATFSGLVDESCTYIYA